MPKVTQTFHLPEEAFEHRLAMKAGDLHSIILDFTKLTREKTKYGSDKTVAIWEPIKEAWWTILNDYGFDPYEV